MDEARFGFDRSKSMSVVLAPAPGWKDWTLCDERSENKDEGYFIYELEIYVGIYKRA